MLLLASAFGFHFPMRILLTADPGLQVPPVKYGGIERIVAQLCVEYRKAGAVVGLVAQEGSTAPTDALFPWPAAAAPGSLIGIGQHALALERARRQFRPDVIHSFSRLAYLAQFLAARRPPMVMSFQRHTGGRSVQLASRLGGKSLRFTGCSEFICQQGRRGGGHWTAIPNFVECARVPFASEAPADGTLLFLSRIEPIKGAHLAIRIARAAGRRLLLAGNRGTSADDQAYWRDEIEPHLGPEVEYVGEVDDAQKFALLARSAALLVPIQWDEPFGIVFAEALAAGVPVLTCARGATPEIVEPGRTGFFVTGVEDGAEAVRRLPGLRREDCRAAALARFDAAVVARQYLQLLHEHIAT